MTPATRLLRKEDALTRHSYYEASVTRPSPFRALDEQLVADVCVVGAGYAGLSAALELATRGYAVVVLDARRLGWGASGRNGGQVIAGYGFGGEDAIEAQMSAQDARRAWDISVESIALLHRRIREHAIECDFVPGYMSLAVNGKKARALTERVDYMAQAYDYPLQAIAAKDIRNWIASDRFYAGAYDPHSGHVHPLKYCLGLADAAHQAGVRMFEDSAVIGLQRASRPTVKTATGAVHCNFVVLAGNVYLDEFGRTIAPEIAGRIMPVGTYIIATEPMDPQRANRLIRYRAAVSDTNHILDYFRLSADHRLLFGGGESYTTATPRNLTARMRKRMLGVFPQLADLAITHTWGGFVDLTMNHAPDFGRVAHNIYYVQGFSGHGLSLAGMAGKMVADTICGQAERFDLLSRIQHRHFPGGRLLRMPALVLGMLYYQLLDWL